jgi:SAM-dependent methyltransferase
MPDFSTRSYQEELMDDLNAPTDELHLNLDEIIQINKITGGPNVSIQGVKKLLVNTSKKEIHFVDIGCGGGDMLAYLAKQSSKLGVRFKLTGVDFQPKVIDFAKKKYPWLANQVNWVVGDYKELLRSGLKADIFHAALFCHHFTDEELIPFFRDLSTASELGFVINDLQRHPLAYYGIKVINTFASKSRFTKHDAPLSVLRAFKKNELQDLFVQTGLERYSMTWKWAFRYLVVGESVKNFDN